MLLKQNLQKNESNHLSMEFRPFELQGPSEKRHLQNELRHIPTNQLQAEAENGSETWSPPHLTHVQGRPILSKLADWQNAKDAHIDFDGVIFTHLTHEV